MIRKMSDFWFLIKFFSKSFNNTTTDLKESLKKSKKLNDLPHTLKDYVT